MIYPILLRDSIEVIASLPNQPLQHHSVAIPQEKQTKLFQEFYLRLNPIYNPRDSLPLAQQLYDAMVRPFESALEQQSIQTLVFVPDGPLRSLPLAALHDGKQYILEKYRIALTPGMQLLTSRLSRSENISILATGMSEGRHGFSPLPAVEKEIAEIKLLVG